MLMCFERDASPPLVEHNIHRINQFVKVGLCHLANWFFCLTPGKKSSMIGVEPIVSNIIFQCVDRCFPPCARMEVEPIFR